MISWGIRRDKDYRRESDGKRGDVKGKFLLI